jgi:1,4-alpha-glucan branching enzyme
MGANLVAGGATFRAWAPDARDVYVVLRDFDLTRPSGWKPTASDRLVRNPDGVWEGFVAGVRDGDPYRFWVAGESGQGYKRDPYARELELYGYPNCNCLVRDPAAYGWRCADFTPPKFHELILYQLHIGVYSSRDAAGRDNRRGRVAKFFDVLDRLPHLVSLGVNAIQPLPVVEWQGEHSKGYNGTDLFSPEMDYAVASAELGPYLARINALVTAKGKPAYSRAELEGQCNQLKAFVDVCHLYGLAVVLDVVYNHAGGNFDDQSLRFFDRPWNRQWWDKDSHFLGGDGWAGGRIFDYSKPQVRQFLIDNAKFFIDEYRVDGFRYDEVRVIQDNGGWSCCQDLTNTLHYHRPANVNIAEYWKDDRPRAVTPPGDGLGFDAEMHDGLRNAIRRVIDQASGGRDARVDMHLVRDALRRPDGFPAAWRAVQYVEGHDLLDFDHGDRVPRVAALADPSNARSWYARSRARVATGLVLTAPGIPSLFMGQEFLEDKPWSDNATAHPELLIYWDELDRGTDGVMCDFLRFARAVVWLRRSQPGLCGEGLNPYYANDLNRVLAFQRWVEGEGRDAVVVASLQEFTWYDYRLGFPHPGEWREVFNSDAFDSTDGTHLNPTAAGNGGRVIADGPPRDGLDASASLTIPANGLLVFARS